MATDEHRISPAFIIDAWYMALTIWAEARGEGERGMRYVAWVIRNRVRDPRWPNTVRGVVTQPRQFSCWNKTDPNRPLLSDPLASGRVDAAAFMTALRVAIEVLTADEKDNPIPGVFWYYASWIKPPAWAAHMEVVPLADSGQHVFLREASKA